MDYKTEHHTILHQSHTQLMNLKDAICDTQTFHMQQMPFPITDRYKTITHSKLFMTFTTTRFLIPTWLLHIIPIDEESNQRLNQKPICRTPAVLPAFIYWLLTKHDIVFLCDVFLSLVPPASKTDEALEYVPALCWCDCDGVRLIRLYGRPQLKNSSDKKKPKNLDSNWYQSSIQSSKQ